MSLYTLDDTTLRELAADIAALPPRPHHAAVLEAANRVRSGCTFRHALSRGGWYRPGGVLAADGQRLADSVEAWVKAGMRACGDDFNELVECHAAAGLQVTRHTGRTHYFVAPYGPLPADFLQLEVEELQEVQDRALFDPDNLPQDMQELMEPIAPLELDAQAVGAPHYRFRRLLDVRQAVARAGNAGLARLFTEWTHSSAAARRHFSDHWVIGLREHLDRYRNPVTSISLVSRRARELKPFQWNTELAGPGMLAQLQAFDRAAGYPAAWYFHLVASTLTPPAIAYALARDLEEGFSYLPETEAALIRSWVAAPYSV